MPALATTLRRPGLCSHRPLLIAAATTPPQESPVCFFDALENRQPLEISIKLRHDVSAAGGYRQQRMEIKRYSGTFSTLQSVRIVVLATKTIKLRNSTKKLEHKQQTKRAGKRKQDNI